MAERRIYSWRKKWTEMVFKRGMPRKRDDCVERDIGWEEIERCMFYSGHGELMNLSSFPCTLDWMAI